MVTIKRQAIPQKERERYIQITNELAELAWRIAELVEHVRWPITADSLREVGQQAEWLSQKAFKYAAELEEKHASPPA